LKKIDSSRCVALARASGAFAGRIAFAAALLAVFLTGVADAQARTHRSQSWADTQFAKAESQREALNGRPEQARTRRDYETIIALYRSIVLEAPTSTKADGSSFAVAEVTSQMGRQFKDDMALYAAVREYKFLRREYPGSKHRIQALLAIGEIYQNDLEDASDARAAFEELLQRYPHSEPAKEARTQLAALSGASDQANATPAQETENSNTPEVAGNRGPSPDNHTTPADAEEKPEKRVRIKDVGYWSSPDYTRIAIDLQQDIRFESHRIAHPDRIYFDLQNVRLSSRLIGRTYAVEDGLVKKVRVAQYKSGCARVVIETAEHANYNASLSLNPPQLVIDIHGDDSHAPRVETAEETKPALTKKPDPLAASNAQPSAAAAPATTASLPKKVIVEADDHDATDAAPANPKTGAKAKPTKPGPRPEKTPSALAKMQEAQPTADGDRSLIRTLGLKIGKIVIDPGHGGHDTGTIGPNGLYEKDLVLDVSKRLGKLLEARLGAEVVYTRDDDTFIPLEQRTAIANQEAADLFVSVHANSSHDPDARGVETYYLNFTSSADALEVAARENAASDKSIHELQDLVKKIALKEKIEESREFASDVQQALHSGLAAKNPGERDRGVKKAPFVVLIGANMPSILAEISFISNPADARRLKTPEYRQRIAEALYRGISRYVNGLGGVKLATKVEKASAE
jgi:N-acetylmuramoyl-L-alanine amidase